MTRYDPFAYGEVHLDPNQQKGAPPKDADDLLFAEGEQVKQAPPADASWELLNEDIEGLLPGAAPVASEPSAVQAAEFGAEILGEEAFSELGATEYLTDSLDDAGPGSAPAVGPPELPAAEPAPAASLDAPTSPSKAKPSRDAGTPARAGVRVAPKPSAPRPNRARRKANLPRRRRSRLMAGAVPLLLCAAGGTAASWFWVIQGNPVMAGILGATTLVGALFAWLFLRG